MEWLILAKSFEITVKYHEKFGSGAPFLVENRIPKERGLSVFDVSLNIYNR